MPWTPSSAKKHDKKASTPAKQAQWSAVANSVLKRTGDDARAIKSANSVILRRNAGLHSVKSKGA
jgi:hypothetical protein